MPRIPYADVPDLPPANIFRLLGHRADLLESFRDHGQALVTAGELDGRATEIVVTAVAAALGSDYLWSHHSELARTNGVTDAELDAIRGGQVDSLGPADRALVAYARKVDDRTVADADVDALRELGLTPSAILELTLLASFYGMTARFIEALDIPLEEGRPGLKGS